MGAAAIFAYARLTRTGDSVMSNRITILAGMMALAVVTSGCAKLPPPLAATMPDVEGYRLGPGDKLRITVYNEPGLTGEFTVTGSGTIAFPLIGGVPAGDRTIEALQDAIRAKLAQGYAKDPRVSVEVLNYRPYYILGEINKPGEYPYSTGLSVEQAVAAAGGFTYRAKTDKVLLRRARPDEEGSVDLSGPAVHVLPGDTIRVVERYF